MLSNNRKSSPTRIAAGLVGVSALTLAALGLTASATQAAERIKSRVEAATGITLPQDAPPAPPAPAEALPAAPHIERHVIRTDDGKGGKQERRVVMVRREHGEMADIPDLAEIEAMIPEIQSRNCGKGDGEGDGKGGPMVIHNDKDGKKQVTVICVNRIEGMADNAMRRALMGLHMARDATEAGTMTAEQKRYTLKSIDDAIRELEKQSVDKH